jgi:hypothetical protein
MSVDIYEVVFRMLWKVLLIAILLTLYLTVTIY